MKLTCASLLLAGLGLPLLAHSAEHCFAMADAATGKWLVREGLCDMRQPPMSTFKVPISLMGYDAGVLKDEHTPLLPFKQGYPDWMESWRAPTDPAAWMKNSVVWYSQQVTLKLGQRRFASYVKRFNYGNGDISGDAGQSNGLTASWLSSSLRISPDEQIGFLRRVVQRELGVAPAAYDMTAALTLWPDAVDGWQVHGKTGSGTPVGADGRKGKQNVLGWYVGWIDKGDRRLVFALMNIDKPIEGSYAGPRAREAFLQRLQDWARQEK